MSAPAFTPGPWRSSPDLDRPTIDIRGADSDVFIVAEVWDYLTIPGRTEANARLIASAPELYAALERAGRALIVAIKACAPDADPAEHKAMIQINAALAKARDEP